MKQIKATIKNAIKFLAEGLFFKRLFWSFNANKNERAVCITFDDGPSGETTVKILDILKKNHVRAVFFITGQQAQKHPEILQRIRKDGHFVGNHSVSHLMPNRDGRLKYIREIISNELIINNIIPDRKFKKIVRPPYGYLGILPSLILIALGYRIFMWTKDSNDSYTTSEEQLLNQLDEMELTTGDILLFHDDYEHTAACMDTIIQKLQSRGFNFSSPLE